MSRTSPPQRPGTPGHEGLRLVSPGSDDDGSPVRAPMQLKAPSEPEGCETEHRLRQVMQSLPVAVYTTDAQGRITFYNRAAAALWGREPEIGVDLWCGSWRIFSPEDGSPVPLETCPMAVALREGRPVRGAEIIVERPDGSRRFVQPFPDPLRDRSGAIVGATNTLLDLTDRKAAEDEVRDHRDRLDTLVKERTAALEESHRRLRLSERLASIGTLSAGLGHDIANLLVPIRIRLEALASAPLPEESRDDVDALCNAVQYLHRLSSGLRLLSLDPDRAQLHESVDLGTWWSDVGPIMKNALPRGVTLGTALPESPCWARMSRAALTQAVFNLVQNAGDAMAAGRGGDEGSASAAGRVTVWAERAGGAAMAKEVRVGVSDDGPGMSPEVRAHCMEPYFTTKTRGMSTGFGLMLVYGLVSDAGGRIEIDSEPGRGTTFIITLLAGTPPPSAAADGQARGAPTRAAVRLGDLRLRAFLGAELRALGCEVIPHEGEGGEHEAHILVVDHLGSTGGARAVVLFAEAPAEGAPAGVLAVGRRPSPRSIRDALLCATRIAVATAP